MRTKVIVLGINRSGTKLASYLIVQRCGLRSVCFEPFYWEGGVYTKRSDDWGPQLRSRVKSKVGLKEHKKLPVYCNGMEQSKWLDTLLNAQEWDLVKFVEIGRTRLYHSICPDAIFVGLIREPIGQFQSLRGSTIQKDWLLAQWKRLRKELKQDPLPNAHKWLPEDLAECARLYASLYPKLKADLPEHSIRVSYEKLREDDTWIEQISSKLHCELCPGIEVPMMGVSTKQELTHNENQYLIDHLHPVYESFLS